MNGPILRDIHVPPAPWWPPGPGWWLVAALVLIALVVAAWLLHRHAARAALRAALREIDALQVHWQRTGDAAASIDHASRLLRRAAVRVDPQVAAQSGDAWRSFVLRYARAPATREALAGLLAVRFRAPAAIAVPALCGALRAWCRVALVAPRGSRAVVVTRALPEVGGVSR